MQVLVDSKADMEARSEVAMLPVQPGVCHICGGGDDAIEGGAAVWCMIKACRRGVSVGSAVPWAGCHAGEEEGW